MYNYSKKYAIGRKVLEDRNKSETKLKRELVSGWKKRKSSLQDGETILSLRK